MKKQLLLLILMTLMPTVASADATGKCGENLIWNYVSETGVLTISGTGIMKDYEYRSFNYAPWYDFKGSIKTIIINSGVTSIGNCAFYNCSGLISIVIPNSVISIGDYAFQGCNTLSSITIPNSVLSIGSYAFGGCSGIVSITIPNSVTSIGGFAFVGCSSLTSITIPNSVTTLGTGIFTGCNSLASPVYNETFFAYMPRSYNGEYIIPDGIEVVCGLAFSNCKDLTSVFIPNSMTTIGEDAFSDCNGLTSITIPNNVTTIESYAFYGCSGLTSVTFGNGLANIGAYAFYDCGKLTSITVPNNVKTIGNYAFAYCLSLSSIIIGNNVESIGEGAFRHCILLSSIIIPNSVTNIGVDAFKECNALSSPIHNNMLFAYMPPSFEGEYIIPEGVIIILDEAFQSCSGLTSITIPNSVTNIGTSAFRGCNNLVDITVNIEEPLNITENTFTNKNARLRVPYRSKPAYAAANYWKEFKVIVEIIPPSPNIIFADANVKAICVGWWDLNDDGELSEAEAGTVPDISNAFSYNSKITSFDELKYFTWINSIGEFAFRECNNLTSITIPDNVTSIVRFAFNGCSSLTSITIPNSVTTIGGGAFCNSALNAITIPNSVMTIGDNAFSSCKELKSVIIPNSVTSIGEIAFSECNHLTSVTIGNSVSSIGGGVFNYCTALTSIIVEEGNGTYDSRDNCNAIIETATNTLVAGCKNTIIPNSVTSIGNSAFQGRSSITTIMIPNSVTNIGNAAFDDCSGLNDIIIPSSVASIGSWAFMDCTNLTKVTIMCKTPPEINIYNPPFTNEDKITLYVPASCKSAYEAIDYWKGFKEIVAIATENEKKCMTPTISFTNGKLKYTCETEDVTFHYSISAPEFADNTGNNIELSSTYTIKVYATKEGYIDSDVATADIDIRGLKGDVNDDGVVDIADAVNVVDIILRKSEEGSE